MKTIVKLLRFLGNCGCRLERVARGGAEHCRLDGPGGRSLEVPAPSVEEARSRGLVTLRGDRLFATSEARPFIRRFLAAREEAYLDQHRRIEIATVVEREGPTAVRINAAESPLGLLARLKDRAGEAWFSAETIAAGERLARDFQFAALQPRLTQSYVPQVRDRHRGAPGAGAELKDSVVAARLRVARAVDAMGPELSGVALDVCCFEKGLETVERERRWPARSAKLMLKAALQQLHRHYHPAPPRPRASHAWGAEGYRPELTG